ncbi:MAG: transketolase [Proteobacteria bacterium]|nr:transketolase [Pseudomonadota bacterium]
MPTAEELARRIRRDMLTLAHTTKTPHIGPALSCVDILTTLYAGVMKTNRRDPLMADRDRFILSKGHGALALYACLHHTGFLSRKDLLSYCRNGGPLAEHPLAHQIPSVEFATGSLGHGLAVGIGMAMAARIKKARYRVFVLMGDGECNEGSVWEAAGFASTMRMDNLIAIVDHNGLQATDRYEKLSGGFDLTQAWGAFGWETREVDGHDIAQMRKVCTRAFFSVRKPKVVIAHTVKGKGVSFMENDLEWHYRWPDARGLAKALGELNNAT